VDELLLEAFRHNAWATKRLLEFSRTLTPGQLNATATGTYGTIISTFNHLIYADAGYLPRAKVNGTVQGEIPGLLHISILPQVLDALTTGCANFQPV